MGRSVSGTLARIVVLGAMMWVVQESGRCDETAADDSALIREILEQLAAQREEIFSATIRYRWHLASYRRAENTPERVHALLDEHDLAADPDSLRELVHALVPEPATIDPPWESRTFRMLGEKRRADSSQNLIQLVDGEHEMRFEGINEQLTVDQRGRSSIHLTKITDFRSYPPEPPHGLRAEDFRVAGRDADLMILETVPPDRGRGGSLSRYTFDRATGVMTHLAAFSSGELSREVWQRALTEFPGGIVMPAVRVATWYEGGRLVALRVFLIEEAEFNGPVADETFVMPVAAGTVVVDARFPEKRIRRTKSAVEDVRSILLPVGAAVPRIEQGGGLSWRMVLILNGVALIVIATLLWRRAAGSPGRTGSDAADSR